MKHVFNLIVAASLLTSCATVNSSNTPQKDLLIGTWELASLEGEKINLSKPVSLELTEDYRVAGFMGCNTVSGTYTADNSHQIQLSGLSTTRMTCPDQAVENEVLQTLKNISYFTVEDGKLMLTQGRRAPMATFTKITHLEVVNKYWKLVILDGRAVNVEENQQQEQFFILRSDGTVNGFAGCNIFSGTYAVTEGNRIRFNQNMTTTMRACPDLKLNEADFLKVFSEADNYTVSNNRLYLNVGKRMPLAVLEAVYF